METPVLSTLFAPRKLGPLTLRNGFIRSAAFEGMTPGHMVSNQLIDYHMSVARGGVGMTTVAYAAVSKTGLSFSHQLWLRKEAVAGLRQLTDSIHAEGALASIQIGHCGNMGNSKVIGARPLAPTSRINLYGPTFPRRMNAQDMEDVVADFANAVRLADEAGFDAVEVHAGHGYLISQFLSPYTNSRTDEYGGSFENRSRFMRRVLSAIKQALPPHMAFIVKMNSWDGFKGGIVREEALLTATIIEECGADAIVVSGGFVSRAPMYVMRGRIPKKPMIHYMTEQWKAFFIALVGDLLIGNEPYKEGFFLKEALEIQRVIKIPVIAVGGMNSVKIIADAAEKGIQFVAMARALIEDPAFINKLKNGQIQQSECTLCNFCVAKMYSETMTCQLHDPSVPAALKIGLNDLRNG
ncbi:MAG: NADH:flavin oxidoreductase [Flavobacteriales bacterium]|nr:NADH:flavin oxidoreductase [Flavobacteriales bacterium]